MFRSSWMALSLVSWLDFWFFLVAFVICCVGFYMAVFNFSFIFIMR